MLGCVTLLFHLCYIYMVHFDFYQVNSLAKANNLYHIILWNMFDIKKIYSTTHCTLSMVLENQS